MLLLKYIRDNKQEVINRLKIKNFDASQIIEDLLDADSQRRNSQKQLDDTLAVSKKYAKEIGMLFKTGEREKAEEVKNKSIQLKQTAKELERSMNEAAEKTG